MMKQVRNQPASENPPPGNRRPPPRLKEFFQRWVITTLAFLVAEWLIAGIHSSRWTSLLIAPLFLAVFNMILRPLLVASTVGAMAAVNLMIGVKAALLTLPLQILFFGFLLLAINAGLLMVVAAVVPSFHVSGFWAAFWGGVVISIATMLLNSFTGTGRARISVRRGRAAHPRRPDDSDGPDSGHGPIIDV